MIKIRRSEGAITRENKGERRWDEEKDSKRMAEKERNWRKKRTSQGRK